MDKIPLDECIHRGVYEVECRNFSFGVYNEKTKGFIGIRAKFNDSFLFTELHWDADDNFGTVSGMKFLEMMPDDIEVKESVSFEKNGKKFFKSYEPLYKFLMSVYERYESQ